MTLSVTVSSCSSILTKVYTVEALPGVLGNRGTRAFISGEQGNKGQFFRGTGERRQYWGTGNIENKFSIFGEQGNTPIYFRGTREQVPPPPPPPGRASLFAYAFLSENLQLIFVYQCCLLITFANSLDPDQARRNCQV